jgi:hypothetical protein
LLSGRRAGTMLFNTKPHASFVCTLDRTAPCHAEKCKEKRFILERIQLADATFATIDG